MIECFRRLVSFGPPFSVLKWILMFSGAFLLLINCPSYGVDNFEVLQTNTTVDQSGLIHLFGEIRNISDRPQQDIAIFANFYDQSGENIGNGSGIVPVRSLNMGDISPFEIILLDSEQSKDVSNYSLNITSKTGLVKAENLVITSLKSRPDIFGYYYVSGRISNIGNDTATNVLAIASFYEKDDKIIGLSSAIAEPSNMTSHSISSFTVVMNDKLQSSKINNFSLLIDSDQYTSR